MVMAIKAAKQQGRVFLSRQWFQTGVAPVQDFARRHGWRRPVLYGRANWAVRCCIPIHNITLGACPETAKPYSSDHANLKSQSSGTPLPNWCHILWQSSIKWERGFVSKWNNDVWSRNAAFLQRSIL
jgi:hypothetical protein